MLTYLMLVFLSPSTVLFGVGVVAAAAYLGDRIAPAAHRDLKPANLLPAAVVVRR
jgi:hypothetical protein